MKKIYKICFIKAIFLSLVICEYIQIEKAPYQVSVQYKEKHLCGGSMKSGNFIITAAHCFKHSLLNKNLYTVRVGSTFNDEGKEYKVRKIIVHEKYSKINRTNDIALIFLDGFVPRTGYTQYVTLTNDRFIQTGGRFYLSGWAKWSIKTTIYSRHLKGALIKIVDFKKCSNFYSEKGERVSDSTLFCAIDEGTGVCEGDPGSPLIFSFKTKSLKDSYELVGIASLGAGCDQEGVPRIFTKVSKYVDWIADNMKMLMDTLEFKSILQ